MPGSANGSWARSIRRRCSGSARPAAPARTSVRSASSICRCSSARGAVWCRTATRRSIWAAMYNNLERRSNIWGLSYDQRQKFVESAALETFDPARARRPRLARLRRRVRGRFPEVAAVAVRDPARTEGPLRRPVEGALHGRSGEAHRQRVHVSGVGERQHRGPEGRRSKEDRHLVSRTA